MAKLQPQKICLKLKIFTMHKLVFVLLVLPVFTVSAQSPEEMGMNAINEKVVESQLEFLSSDWTEGRATGTRGAYMAADYIASMFKLYGLEPGGDMIVENFSRRERNQGKNNRTYRGYFQNFQLIEYETGDVQYLSVLERDKAAVKETKLSYKTDFDVSTGHIARLGEAGVVFVGYGYKNDKENYDDYKNLDVEGKIVLRLSGYPGHRDEDSPAYKKFKPLTRWAEYRMSREKDNLAGEMGAIAVVEVDIERKDYSSWATNLPFRHNQPLYEGDSRPASYYDTRLTLAGDEISKNPPLFRITPRVASELLRGSGIDIGAFEKKLAREMIPASTALKDKSVRFETSVNARLINARNVVGVLKGKDTTQMIVVGGHYDHLGKHNGYIWNGADDNASGTVGVMTIAKACMATGEKPEKTIVFAAWTGEEKGLWGSKYFAAHPYEGKEIILNLNYDMISRDNEDDKDGNDCSMMYAESLEEMEGLTSGHLEDYDINLDIRYRPMGTARGGSDHAPFAEKGIPYFYFMAGFPPEYHQPDDHIELVNIPKMTNIIRIGFLNIWAFAAKNE